MSAVRTTEVRFLRGHVVGGRQFQLPDPAPHAGQPGAGPGSSAPPPWAAGHPRSHGAARRQPNQSFAAQYLEYWKHVVTFNFGISHHDEFRDFGQHDGAPRAPLDPRAGRALTTFIAFISGDVHRAAQRLEAGRLARQRPAADLRHDVRLPLLLDRPCWPSTSFPSRWVCSPPRTPTTSSPIRPVLTGTTSATCWTRRPPGLDDPHHLDRRLDPHHEEQRDNGPGRRLRPHGAGQRPEAVEDHVEITPGRTPSCPTSPGFAMSLGFVVSGRHPCRVRVQLPRRRDHAAQRGKRPRLPADAGALPPDHRGGAPQCPGADVLTAILDPRTREHG